MKSMNKVELAVSLISLEAGDTVANGGIVPENIITFTEDIYKLAVEINENFGDLKEIEFIDRVREEANRLLKNYSDDFMREDLR